MPGDGRGSGGGRGGGRGGGGGGGRGKRQDEPQFRVQCLAFSPNDDSIVTGNRDGSIRFWRSDDASPIGPAIPLHDPRMGHIFAVAYHGDGAIVGSGSRDGTVALVDVATRERIGEPWKVAQGDVFALRFLRDGTIVTGGKDGAIRFWSADTHALLGETCAHTHWLYGIAHTPDEQTFASVSEDGTAKLWTREGHVLALRTTLTRPLQTQLRRPGGRHSVAISHDGARVITASHDHDAQVWDVATGEPIGEPLRHDDIVLYVAFHPADHTRAVTAGWDGTIRVWPSGRVIADRLGPVYQIALDTTGTRVATAGWDFATRLFELPSGRPLGAQARDEPPVPSEIGRAHV